jgi:hypothetical protein
MERNPIIRRLKKLRHMVLFGKVGEKAYSRCGQTWAARGPYGRCHVAAARRAAGLLALATPSTASTPLEPRATG